MNIAECTLELPGGLARLEPLRESHALGLLKLAEEDPGMWTFLVSKQPRDEQEMRQWIRHALAAADRGVEQPFAVIDRGTGELAGSTRFMDIQPANRSLEVGVSFYGRKWRRTALNTECKLLLFRRAFDDYGCVRVQLKCDARNEPSRAAIARLGASFEGVLRRHRVLADGYVRDTAYYSVIADEWPAVRDRLSALLSSGPSRQNEHPRTE